MNKTAALASGIVLGIGGSALANLFSRHAAIIVSKLAITYVFLNLVWLLVNSSKGKEIALGFRVQYRKKPLMSYFLVPAIFAAVGWVFWVGINRAFNSQFPDPISTSTAVPLPLPPSPTTEKPDSPIPHPAPQPTPTLSTSELASEIAKRLQGSSPQLYIIRDKAMDLANEITSFAQQRTSLVAMAHTPSGASNQTGQDIQNQINALRQNSPALFDARFSKRLQESISELKSAGIYVGEVEETCQHVMHMSISLCADSLRNAALKIKVNEPSEIAKIRTDAIGIFNRTYADYKKFRADQEFWNNTQAATKRDTQEMVSQNFKELATRFKREYGPEIDRVRNQLMGYIRELPRDSRSGLPYTPPLPIAGDVFPQDITGRLCDLRDLLHAMEKENNMPISDIRYDTTGIAALPCW
jgi:hypothetical protein